MFILCPKNDKQNEKWMKTFSPVFSVQKYYLKGITNKCIYVTNVALIAVSISVWRL